MQRLVDQLAVYIQHNPTVVTLCVMAFIGTLARGIRSKATPGGTLYHAMDVIVSLGASLLDAWNAVRNLLGMGPVASKAAQDSEKTPPVGPRAVGVVLAALAAITALWATPAQAQPLPTCWGITSVHCGPALSFVEVAPLGVAGGLASDVPLAVGGGYQVDVHFRLWDLGLAGFGNLLYFWKGQATGEVSVGVFGCLGDAFGKLHGSCAGLGAPLAGPEGGVFGGWTWRRDIRVVFSAGPDLVGMLAAL
jgi:hypothetical protein